MKFLVSAAIVLCLVAAVHGKRGFRNGEQEWGYVTVRPHAHMFWWLYYSTANVSYSEKPLIIWLQGGPGLSSTGFGNFEHLGPLDLFLEERNHTWVKDYNVLFIDNPVGSGFSYAEESSGFPTNNSQIASDLLECIRAFYTELPQFSTVPVYITAQSYGGKMAVEFAHVWHQTRQAGTIEGNLKGVALMASWISPVDSVLSLAPYLFNMGLADTNGCEEIRKSAELTRKAVEESDWIRANELCGLTEGLVQRITCNIDFYNIMYPHSTIDFSPSDNRSLPKGAVYNDYSSYHRDQLLYTLMNGEVKKTLDINTTWGDQLNELHWSLAGDLMTPVTDHVEYLLNNTDIEVFVLAGQLDLIVNTPGIVAWVERLKWSNATEWLASPRYPLVLNHIIEGYFKKYENLRMYWINRSGHRIPIDNPIATAAVLEDLTRNAF